MFDISDAKMNGPLIGRMEALLHAPRTPFGWKRVVENMPIARGQAHQCNSRTAIELAPFPYRSQNSQKRCSRRLLAEH